ncbi:uncharacterized protein TRIADDRAFT_24602 [Trichoplax adhaerens]|uniref:PWI domain-containing protein n=1 Tax=Trichoplax adhaerens TaxID=10228 RepID=B3RVM6_TRIAD|nr:hypothetical protein TRIADDRAFT_24602 [Trichoplax adhaerens]EDV26023.1 hypothetical protein TRIADDRAFT_24602 [Trichoplax adhaerens]|eukprot:XP_002112056.1 hypothetical protein TRIADDRAFT_24602 [Trichoplax adhaerens]
MASSSNLVRWVSDELHDVIGISDRNIAEFVVGLAKKSQSINDYVDKLRDTGAITVNNKVIDFANQLWDKVPHQSAPAINPARMKEQQALQLQKRNMSYKLLSDSDDDVTSHQNSAKKTKKEKKRKHIRESKWEDDDDDNNYNRMAEAKYILLQLLALSTNNVIVIEQSNLN